MGYEKFVKNIFPFIGNQYSGKLEESKINYKQLIITLDDLTAMYKENSKGAFIDFTQNKLVAEKRVQDKSSLNGKLGLSFQKGIDSWKDVSVIYINDIVKVSIYHFVDMDKKDESIEALFGKDTPFTFYMRSETIEEKDITSDMLGLKYIKFEKIDNSTFAINYILGDVPPSPIPEGEPEEEE